MPSEGIGFLKSVVCYLIRACNNEGSINFQGFVAKFTFSLIVHQILEGKAELVGIG